MARTLQKGQEIPRVEIGRSYPLQNLLALAPAPNGATAAASSQEAQEVVAVPVDQFQVQSTAPAKPAAPPDAVQLAFQLLAAGGKSASFSAANRFKNSQKAGYESLVQFQGPKGTTVSLKTEEELGFYTLLTLKGQVPNAGLQQCFDSYKQAEANGVQFYLKRDKQFLPTDAAGAAISINRGQEIEWSDSDGCYGQTDQPTFKSKERSPQGLLLDQLQKGGYQLQPTPASNGEQHGLLYNVANLALKSLKAAPHPGQARQSVLQSLNTQGSLELTLENDKRPLKTPITVSAAQLEEFTRYLNEPTPQMQQYQQAFGKLVEKGAVVTARCQSGEMKGTLLAADHRSAFLNLTTGAEVLILDKQGNYHSAFSLQDVCDLQSHGKIERPQLKADWDGQQASDNLFMVYYASPFDPVNKGNYDDLPHRLTQVGSSAQVDIVTLHSDLPEKRTLHLDRAQSSGLQRLKELPASTVMSDPKVLQEFIYETVKSNPSDGKIRLLIGGHGGAERGLIPDGKSNNAQANDAMPVDQFSGAITAALDQLETENGKRPKIDNLVLCSCLMGNSSLIHALSKNSDVEVLCASPEIMMGSNPTSFIEHLADPKFSNSSASEFAQFLVDDVSQAPSSPGGSLQTHHADTYGAYSIDKAKGERFQKSLSSFFEACLANPQEASAIKRAIDACPTYGRNPWMNLNFNIFERDIIQVAERIAGDARVQSKEIKKACQELVEATSDQVLLQKATEKYQDRRGPTLYLPVDRFSYDKEYSKTDLLQSTPYERFLELLFDAKIHRDLKQTVISDLHHLMERGSNIAEPTKPDSAKPSPAPTSAQAPPAPAAANGENIDGEKKVETQPKPPQIDTAALLKALGETIAFEAKSDQVRALEAPLESKPLKDLGQHVLGWMKGGLTCAVGLACGVIGGAAGAVLGGLTGLRAGFTGHSKGAREFGGEITSNKTDKETLMSSAKAEYQSLLARAALVPSEYVGLQVHENVGYRYGNLAARLAGSVAGALTGVFGGAATGFAMVAYQGANKTNKVLRNLVPSPTPHKDLPSPAIAPTKPQESSQPEKAKSPETPGNVATAGESAK